MVMCRKEVRVWLGSIADLFAAHQTGNVRIFASVVLDDDLAFVVGIGLPVQFDANGIGSAGDRGQQWTRSQ